MSAQATMTTAARHHANPPQQEDQDQKSWITRGANFVVAVSQVSAGAVLSRDNHPDEYMVLTFDVPALIEANGHIVEAGAQSLTVVPPGNSTIRAEGHGQIVRVFTTKAPDLVAAAGNAATYAGGSPDVAPLVPWPDPPEGYKLRNYVLADHTKPDSNMRIFRCTNLMLNVMTPRMVKRDVRKLSPHSHADFEQGSLALKGDWEHHLRYPWTADMTEWRSDEHLEMGSPSLLVVPPKVIHTSRNANDGGAWLVDIFAPPRVDFSKKPGVVCNADDYPMPAE